MRIVKVTVVSLIIVIFLGACDVLGFDLGGKKIQVEMYNESIEETLKNYSEIKGIAEQHKSSLLKLVKTDQVNSDIISIENVTSISQLSSLEGFSGVTALTEEEKESFKSGDIFLNTYFTSIGAKSIREVIIINGTNHRQYTTVVWSKEGISFLERKVNEK